MKINFFNEDISFKLSSPAAVRRWVSQVVQAEGYRLIGINYIFCSDKHLNGINQQYLNHDTLTDIITFDNSESPTTVEADIFISIERVKDNAVALVESFDRELLRVMIHGVLHLCGYKDKSPTEKSEMREKEDACLSLLQND